MIRALLLVLVSALACARAGGSAPAAAAPAAAHERPLVAPVLLASGMDDVRGLVIDGRDVFFLDAEQVWRVPRDGSGRRQGLGQVPTTIDLAVDRGAVYVSAIEPSRIMRVPRGGGAPVKLADAKDPGSIAVDEKWVYWIDGGSIMRVAKDGSSKASALIPEQAAFDLLVDDETIWWTTADGGSVMRAALDGSGVRVAADELDYPHRLAADATHVYWSDPSAGEIARIAKTGGPKETVLGGIPSITHLAVDDQDVWWTDDGAGTISRVAKAGGAPSTLVWGLNEPWLVAADETGITYSVAEPAAIVRRPKRRHAGGQVRDPEPLEDRDVF